MNSAKTLMISENATLTIILRAEHWTNSCRDGIYPDYESVGIWYDADILSDTQLFLHRRIREKV